MKTVIGNVVAGQGLGSTFGFPTINISYKGKYSGVFAGRVYVDGEWHTAAINIGGRPTVDDKNFCEVFLIDWRGKINSGTCVKVELNKKIRDIKKFSDFEKLKNQIAKDVEFIKKLL